LEHEVVWRRLSVQLAVAVGRSKRSTELLEDTTLACSVFRVLVDRAGLVEVVPAASTIFGLGFRFDLDLSLHVA
jgi:hypothetical protein